MEEPCNLTVPLCNYIWWNGHFHRPFRHPLTSPSPHTPPPRVLSDGGASEIGARPFKSRTFAESLFLDARLFREVPLLCSKAVSADKCLNAQFGKTRVRGRRPRLVKKDPSKLNTTKHVDAVEKETHKSWLERYLFTPFFHCFVTGLQGVALWGNCFVSNAIAVCSERRGRRDRGFGGLCITAISVCWLRYKHLTGNISAKISVGYQWIFHKAFFLKAQLFYFN